MNPYTQSLQMMPRHVGHQIGTPKPVHLVHTNDSEFLCARVCQEPPATFPVFKGNDAAHPFVLIDSHHRGSFPLTVLFGKVNLSLDALPLPLLFGRDPGIEYGFHGSVAVAAW